MYACGLRRLSRYEWLFGFLASIDPNDPKGLFESFIMCKSNTSKTLGFGVSVLLIRKFEYFNMCFRENIITVFVMSN